MISPWHKYLLWSDQNSPLVCADHLTDWPESMLRWFEEQGLLCPAATLVRLDCPECPDAPYRDIHWRENAELGRREPVLRCPSCGPVPLDPDRLRCWSLVPNVLAQTVANLCGLRGDVEMLSHGHLWRLGKTHWSGRPTTVFLGRQLGGGDAATMLAPVEKSSSALLLTIGREPAVPMRNPVSPLSLIIHWDGADLAVDDAFAASQTLPAAVRPTTRSVTRLSGRMALVDRLRLELESHLRSLGEHLRFSRDSGREPAPFPCPTQRDLAARIGTHPSTVTRILTADRELRRLLNLAQDPMAILGVMAE